MVRNDFAPRSQITFLYYKDLAPIVTFYEEVMGFEKVEDQGWAKIYRVEGNAFIGVAAGENAFHRPQEKNAVLITLVVDDVSGWYQYLRGQGVTMLSNLREVPAIQVRCFFCEDPGGYSLEVQEFLKPELRSAFYGDS
jgi:predicted enzyme related to lactoylglutathione lyase